MEVGEELDLAKTGGSEQRGDGFGLAAADFEQQKAAGDERGEGLGDEATADVEAVGAGEKGEGRFVIADLDGEGVAVGQRNVRRIGDHDLELLLGDGREQIALKEVDLVGNAVAVGVPARDGQGGGG